MLIARKDRTGGVEESLHVCLRVTGSNVLVKVQLITISFQKYIISRGKVILCEVWNLVKFGLPSQNLISLTYL